jgi:plasmid stability protein
MPNLLVRDVEPDIVDALKERAARHKRSAEAEHRDILKHALLRPAKRNLAEVLASMPNVGEDEDFARLDGEEDRDVFN